MTPMRPTHPSQKIGSGDAPPDPLAPLAPLDPSPVPQWSAEAIERMRARLIRNEQLAALGRVVAALAHEINNPLSGLLGSIGIMQEIVGAVGALPAAVPDADREELRGLLLDCGTMVDRIRELMNAVRGMSRDCDTEDVAFDPVRAIRDAARVFAIARRHSCHLDLALQALPAVKGSPGRLGQVILSLLQNGLDASAADARLSIAAESNGSQVRITISDHGRGIPADVAPHVFEGFFASQDVAERTGLGLHICREIVTGMGGAIGFDTSPAGTTFRVDLPAYLPDRDL
jgi:two-component system sensor histidine kinase HupT/HoxJ